MAACGYVYDTQYYKQSCRNYRSYETAPFADLSDPSDAFHGYECSDPIDSQYRHKCEYLVGSQSGVRCSVESDVCKRHCAESQYCRIPDCRFYPLKPYGEESGTRSECFAYPAEHSALLVGEHRRKLGRNHCGRDEEDDRCKQVVEC